MNDASPHIAVGPGDGLVARFGDVVVLVDVSSSNAFTSELFAALDASGDGSAPPRELAWMIAQLLVAHAETAPAFGAAIRSPDGYVLMLHGRVQALIADGSSELKLSGSNARTWVDRIVLDPITRISMSLDPEGAGEADPRSDLRAGLVPGGVVVVTPRDQQPTVAAAPPDSVPARPETAEPVVAGVEPAGLAPTLLSTPVRPVGPDGLAPTLLSTPVRPVGPDGLAPTLLSTPVAASTIDGPATVLQSSAEGGQSFADKTVMVHRAAAMLLADDGTRTPLDRDYVFGREPEDDEMVTRGLAAPIVVHDPDSVVSRVQMYVKCEGSVVTVRDAGSSNGTFIAAPGAPDWARLGARAEPLPDGWSIRIGQRVFTHIRTSA